jgi:flavorubredoxin
MTTVVRENIDWVGCVDWNVRDFHGYDTRRGTTYNAYLVRDRKTALVDTVRAPFAGRLLENLAAVCELSQVDYVVCNHAEPDHAGALPEVMRALPGATLLCDARCRAALAQHFDTAGWKVQVVADGQAVSLGARTLRFLETPMVHWPESMWTCVPEEKLLFSMDVFGQHYATSERFDDQVPGDILMEEAKAYYANIIMPYAPAMGRCLDKIGGLDVELIAPSHGVIWRRDAARIVAAYRDWVACRPKAKVLVLYDTMWEHTGRMAEAIAAGAAQPGVEVQLIHLRHNNLTQIAAEVLDAAALALGSPTLNRGMMPAAAAALHYLAGLRPQGKVALAFGSYGWGPSGVEAVQQGIAALAWEVLRPPIKCQYRPTPEVLDECRQAGRLLAERALRTTSVGI